MWLIHNSMFMARPITASNMRQHMSYFELCRGTIMVWLEERWMDGHDPDSKVHGAKMGPMWAPCWPHDLCYLGNQRYKPWSNPWVVTDNYQQNIQNIFSGRNLSTILMLDSKMQLYMHIFIYMYYSHTGAWEIKYECIYGMYSNHLNSSKANG